MSAYNRFEVNQFDYNKLIQIQLENNADIKEQTVGSRRKLFVGNSLLATTCQSANLNIGKITNQMFKVFLSNFNKQLIKQFLSNDALFTQSIAPTIPARSKNQDIWSDVKVGQYFYCVDINSAYWQVAFMLGYINEPFYQKYLRCDEYKQAKRYCISFLARQNKSTYISNGCVTNHITCDTSLFRGVYENIRHKLYNLVNEMIEAVDNKQIQYNVDAIYVLSENLETVQGVLKRNNLLHKIIECRKVGENEYTYKGKTRKFK